MRITSATFVRSSATMKDAPRERIPQVAFAGRSNVGKSSLINYLVKQKGLAKTSKTPGKTRMLNFFLINGEIFFVDLPGYGFARIPPAMRDLWVRMMEEYFGDNPNLRAVVWLLDVRREPSEEDHRMWEMLRMYQVPVVIAITKCDKVSHNQLQSSRARIRKVLGVPPEVPMVPTAATSRMGGQELLGAIAAVMQGERL